MTSRSAQMCVVLLVACLACLACLALPPYADLGSRMRRLGTSQEFASRLCLCAAAHTATRWTKLGTLCSPTSALSLRPSAIAQAASPGNHNELVGWLGQSERIYDFA